MITKIYHLDTKRFITEGGEFKSESLQKLHFRITFRAEQKAIKYALMRGMYDEVAEVYCDDYTTSNSLEDAYQVTQNIDENWTRHRRVETSLDGCRSSMTGDIFVDDDGAYTVEACGFGILKNAGI